MAYKLTFKTLDLPKRCPVCAEGRKDAAAIATHNVMAAAIGCRVYVGVGK